MECVNFNIFMLMCHEKHFKKVLANTKPGGHPKFAEQIRICKDIRTNTNSLYVEKYSYKYFLSRGNYCIKKYQL